jgi:hypothetical protein
MEPHWTYFCRSYLHGYGSMKRKYDPFSAILSPRMHCSAWIAVFG